MRPQPPASTDDGAEDPGRPRQGARGARASQQFFRFVVLWKAGKTLLYLAAAVTLVCMGDEALRLAHRFAGWLAAASGGVFYVRELGELLERHLTARSLHITASLAALSSLNNGIQALGLHFRRRWAAWFAVVVGTLLVPAEIHQLVTHRHPLALAALTLNLAFVAFLVFKVRHDASIWRG